MTDFVVNLSQRTAIVTGAGTGVGRAITLALGSSGAAVAVNDINPDRTYQITQELLERGVSAIGLPGDVGNRFQVAALIESARERFGKVHILVNAAGVYKPEAITKIDEWDWRRHLDVNLTGAFFCCQLISRVMIDEGTRGAIVNIATGAWNGTLPTGLGYIASKAGLVGLTRQAARELAPAGIRVNAVCPSNIADDDTPSDTPAMLGVPGAPEDVANVVVFLCSEAARFITGQVIHVDGGALR